MKIQHAWSAALAAGLFAAVAGTAQAHGAVEFPIARQLQCLNDGGFWWPADGSGVPNAACRAAFQRSGNYPFTQYHEVAALTQDYRNPLAVRRQVPDGALCSAGDAKKAGLDAVSSAWHKTPITLENGKFRMLLLATAPHNPSYVEIYLSRPGYSAARSALRWDDLDLIHQASAPMPETIGGKKYYVYDVPVPAGRTGDAVVYTRWQREDPAGEGFYNCSDVTFEGGGTVPTFPWHEWGYFLGQGFAPKAGETVQFRVLGPSLSGKELVTESIAVTPDNAASHRWALELGARLNGIHGEQVRVGVRHGDDIHLDTRNVQANQVFLKDKDSSVSMSILSDDVPPVKPEPPVTPPGDYPKWPAGIGQYQSGDIVEGVDGKLWQCKPFPHGAWCNINAWAYTPGGKDVPPAEDQRAWRLAE